MRQHAKEVYKVGGISNFYSALQPSMVMAVVLGASQMVSYDTTKQAIIRNGILKDGNLCQFISGVVSGFCIAFSVTPLDNMKTRMMTQVDS